MVNKSLFMSAPGAYVPPADTTNEAGGSAYAYTPQQALAQFACAGTLNGSYYTGARETLDTVKALCAQVDSEFIAATAVYARRNSFMKDMPALLLAILAGRCKNPLNPTVPGVAESTAARCLEKAAPYVLDNGKMVRNFVQILRSGAVGRKSFGTVPRRVVAKALLTRHENALLKDTVGNDPTLRDVIRLARPKPRNKAQEQFFGYLVDSQRKVGDSYEKRWHLAQQPDLVQQYESFKVTREGKVPNVDFRQLDALQLTTAQWTDIALNAGWHMVRMNLNTFKRHGVLEDEAVVKRLANKLRDPQAIRAARVFPYQLMTAFNSVSDIPSELLNALQDAMEVATENVLPFGRGAVAVDVSGSMASPVMVLGKVQSKTRVIDVAALIAAVLMRKESRTIVLPFDTNVYVPSDNRLLNPRDSIMTLANQLAKFGGGGTACQLPMQYLVEKKVTGLDYVLYASDNESWFMGQSYFQADNHGSLSYFTQRYGDRGTTYLQLWEQLKQLNPSCKLICCNLAISTSAQAPTRRDILNIGGFSDDVFKVAAAFVQGKNPDHWVEAINSDWDLLTSELS